MSLGKRVGIIAGALCTLVVVVAVGYYVWLDRVLLNSVA